MPQTIANAIAQVNSNRQFTNCYPAGTILGMDKSVLRVDRLRKLVNDECDGPADFARKYSKRPDDDPIDPTYVSQLLNGHRSFGEKAALNMARRSGLPDDYFDSPLDGAANDGDTEDEMPIRVRHIINAISELRNNTQFLASIESIIHMAQDTAGLDQPKVVLNKKIVKPTSEVRNVRIAGHKEKPNATKKSQHL